MGERLGRYKVLKHLASGGMADVLLALTDGIEGFERHVVLKRIKAEHAKDQRFIDMFLDEARLAANLHHQNVVQVHDIGESEGEYFFAMEYIHGEDLRAILSVVAKTRTHIPLGIVCSVISSVAAGLHYAHERRGSDKKQLGIVHRDVSPSNVIVGYDGSVKIVDFGIAKAAMRQVETRSGSLKGKVSYMSPEQCKMGTVDRRSDIYALGVVLYELATTTRLFKSDSDYLVMDAICTGKIPLPRVRRADLPNELSTIIMTALATDPERRYQTAEELRTALDQFAIKAGLTASAGTLASYIHKLFGERPEPWLDTGPTPTVRPEALAETRAGRATDPARTSWTELPRVDASGRTDEAKTITDGKGRRASTPLPVAATVDPASTAASIATPAATPEPASHTSTKLGWENKGTSPPGPGRTFTPSKIAMIAVPLVALLGIVGWKLAGSSSSTKPEPAPRDVVATTSDGVAAGGPSAAVASASVSAGPVIAAAAQAQAAAGDPAAPTTATPGVPATTATGTTSTGTGTTSRAGAATGTTSGAGTGSSSASTAQHPATVTAPTAPSSARMPATASIAPSDAQKPGTAAVKPAIATKPAAPATTLPVTKPLVGSGPGGTTTAVAPKPLATAATPVDTAKPAAGTNPGATPTKPTAAKPGVQATATTVTGSAAPVTSVAPTPTTVEPAKPVTPPTGAGAPIAQVPPGVVEQLASKHRRTLLACEGTETLSGDVTVTFQINADGHIVKSQVSSTLGKPAVANCILTTVRGWRFPKPASGSATGVYAIAFQ